MISIQPARSAVSFRFYRVREVHGENIVSEIATEFFVIFNYTENVTEITVHSKTSKNVTHVSLLTTKLL